MTAEPSTRERILAAAATALSTRGYPSTHLTDIARLAGLQPPAVYYYFSSREDLITAVMCEGQRMVRDHVCAQLDALPPDASAAARVATAVEAHLRLELELSDFASAVTRNAGQLPPRIRTELERESQAFHDIWRRLLSDAEKAGVLRPDISPTVGRMLVIGALNWATAWWRPTIPVDDVVSTAQEMVLGGLFDL